MLLSEQERNKRIDSFLSRKFKQFDLDDEEPSIHSIRAFGESRA